MNPPPRPYWWLTDEQREALLLARRMDLLLADQRMQREVEEWSILRKAALLRPALPQ